MESNHVVILSVGSNTPDSESRVSEALKWLGSKLNRCECSEIYLTPAVGHHDSPPYHNAVVRGEYDGEVSGLDLEIKRYEIRCGRDAESRRINKVPVDVDIVAVDGCVLRHWDWRQDFFRRGYNQLELAGPPIEQETDSQVYEIGDPHGDPRGRQSGDGKLACHG